MTLQECFEAVRSTFPFTVHWDGNDEPCEFTGFHLGPDEIVDGFQYAKGWFTTHVGGFTLVKKQLKLEVGKSYKNRQGKVVTIASKTQYTGHRGDTFIGKDGWTYDFDGFWSRNNTDTNDVHAKWDLLEEFVELKLEAGKSYKTRSGAIVKMIYDSKDNLYTYHPDYNGGTSKLFYYIKSNGKCNIHSSHPSTECIEEVKENIKYSLEQILANNKLPVTVVKTGGRDNFGLGTSYKLNTPLKVIKVSSGNVYFEGGGYIGIKSLEGAGLCWEIAGENKAALPAVITPTIEPIKITPEQELFLKEKTTAAQVLLVENNVRLALFSRTMNKVKKEDVEKVVDVVYGKKKGKEFTQKQLNKAINKAVTELYGENLTV